MKILILNSNRIGGVGYGIEQILIKNLKENHIVNYVNLKYWNIEECLNCGKCSKCLGGCVHNDDYFSVLQYINEADLIINIVPMYNAQPPANFKTLVDRGQMVFHSKYTHNNSLINRDKNRKEIRIITCGSKFNEKDYKLMNDCMNHFNRNYNCENICDLCVHNLDYAITEFGKEEILEYFDSQMFKKILNKIEEKM